MDPFFRVGQLAKGRKITEIDPIEAMEFESKMKRMKALNHTRRRTELDMEEIDLWRRKWWIEIRKKYDIETDNLTYDEGVVYEGKFE